MSLYIYIKIDNVIITLDVVSVGSRISSVSIAKNNDDEMHPFFQGTLLIYEGMQNACLFNPSYYYCTSVFINSRMLMDYLRSILSERIPHGTLNEVHVGGPYQIT